MNSPSVQAATHCLEVDHRALDAVLLEAEKAARAGSFPDARRQFAAFASGLVRHIEAEESVLFPEIEEVHPATRGPTAVMRAEHHELRALVGEIGEALETPTDGWATSFRRLKELLLAHNAKEERVLYPMADAALQSGGRSGPVANRLSATLENQSERA
jgi:hemerythrin-like domain-containing protein